MPYFVVQILLSRSMIQVASNNMASHSQPFTNYSLSPDNEKLHVVVSHQLQERLTTISKYRF